MPKLRKRLSDRDSGDEFLGGTRETVRDSTRSLFSFIVPSRDGYVARQAKGTYSRFRSFAGWLSVDRLLPQGIAEQLQRVFVLTPQAFGVRNTSRTKQFSAAVILAILAYIATILSAGATIGVAIVMTLLIAVALLRNIPAFNERWQSFTSSLPIKRDYNIVGWKRE